MKRNIIIVAILIVVLAVLGLVLSSSDFSTNESQNESQNVILEAATDKAFYNSGEEVSLNINLTNLSEAGVCLSEGAIGNIRFTSFTRDGNNLEIRSAPSYFLTSFSEILKSRLTLVSPGDKIEFNITSTFDPGLGVEALSTTMPEDTSGMATFYNVEAPGQYEIGLVYEYVGRSSDSCPDILEGPTNIATVTFTVE